MSGLIEQEHDDSMLNYRPLITYQYQVNGRAYQSDHLAFGKQTSWQQGDRGQRRVTEHVRQYPVNGAATVHYNPSNPADAVPEVHTTGISNLIGVAIVLGVIGAGWWLGANWLIRQ